MAFAISQPSFYASDILLQTQSPIALGDENNKHRVRDGCILNNDVDRRRQTRPLGTPRRRATSYRPQVALIEHVQRLEQSIHVCGFPQV
jgi:hypothetical protein